MRVICVDDEQLVLDLVVYLCEQLPQIDEVKGFTNAREALEWVKNNRCDLAILDIDMPEIDGINLAVKLKQVRPDTAVIFLTGYSQYAMEAFKIHAQGYLLKPVNKEQLAAEVTYALSVKAAEKYPRFYARTFGEFDFLVDGVPVHFARSKSKELLAFLVDKCGTAVSRATIFAALYEDVPYDRGMQKQLDVMIRSLKETLARNGAAAVLEIRSGQIRVNTALFDCDLYRLMKGDVQAVNAFKGEYMSAYPWASMTEAQIAKRIY